MAIRKRSWTSGGSNRTAWVVDYKDQNGKRRLKTFKTKKQADSWWADAVGEVKRGTHTPDAASITVEQGGKDWIERAELDGRERSTIDQYQQHTKFHINPRVGEVKLSRLTTPEVERFRDDLLRALSRPMAKKVLASLKGILKEAQRRGNVAQNVAASVSIRIEKRHRRKLQVGVDVPTPKEVRMLLAELTGRWRPLIVTAIFTGLRASELRGLTWANVDLIARVICVRQRADKWNALGSPKSEAGERDVPLPPMVVNTLSEWRSACPESGLDLVFPTGSGGVEGLPNISRRGLAPAQVAAGVIDQKSRAKYSMHALRHFYASWLIGQGFKAKRVQQLMGHSSIQMTFDVYGHWFPSEEDDHERLAAGELALVG